MSRPAAAAPAVGAVLLVLALVTGALHSPLLPVLAAWAGIAAASWPRRSVAAAAAAGAALLLVTELVADGVGLRDGAALAAAALAALAIAGWAHTREARHGRRLAELNTILAETERGERKQPAAAAAARLGELRRLLATLRERTGATRVMVWDVDGAGERATVRVGSEPGQTPGPILLRGDPLGWVWSEGTPVRMDAPVWSAAGTTVITFRLDRDGAPGALATFEFEGAGAPASPAAVDDVARHLGAELTLHDRSAALEADRRRTQVLVDTLRRIPAVTAPDEFAAALLAGAVELTDATGGVVATWRDDVGRVLAVGGDDGGTAAGREFGPLESELALAARANAELLRAPRERGGLAVATPDELWVRAPRALAVLPLATSHGVVGVLAVWSSLTQRFDEAALELLRTLAPHAALQLEQALEYGRLRESAERDPLTGLRNRRAFDRALAREAARLDRYGHPLALLVLDLDHFKAINDQFGHEAGDAVLQGVARRIEAAIRDVDLAARFGGEEFVVLLPETSLAAAAEVAERLRRSVEAWEMKVGGDTVPVRVSIGASACPQPVSDPKQLVRSADTALYQAKREGRNRVAQAATG